MFYTNKNFPFIQNAEIIEWDIASGNTSIMQYYNLYPNKIINKLKSLDKQERVVAIGKLMKKDPEFSKKLEKGFNDIVDLFIAENSLLENDIISVKRDAIFVKNFTISKSAFGDCVNFIPKNEYNHFMLLPRYEFYIGKSIVDVKGISDEVIDKHKNGILSFIVDICNETDKIKANLYMKDFVYAYKNRELELDFYRRFDSDSKYDIVIDGYGVTMDNIDESYLDSTDISFNYFNVVLPVMQLVLAM